MNILTVPFHKLLNIKKSERSAFTFKIDESPELLNHLGTIHACVQLSLAEATSGQYLLSAFYDLKDEVIPLVRRTEVKYQKPANGSLYAKANFKGITPQMVLNDLNVKGRAIVPIKVEVYNQSDTRTLCAVFDWLVTKKK